MHPGMSLFVGSDLLRFTSQIALRIELPIVFCRDEAVARVANLEAELQERDAAVRSDLQQQFARERGAAQDRY